MRNLKKLFAVIITVAMLASMMVPALAAEYNDDAAALQDLGLFQGYGNGDLGLDDDLTREQGLALMLRVMGLEEDVKAMSEEEIAAELAKVVDPETITDTWAKPYVAYAVQNGLTKGIDGSILPNVKFAGQLKMTGKEFINLMLNGMGYNTGWDDVLTKAAEVEMLSAGEAVTFGTITELNRDFAVGIMAKALTGITADDITLAEALIDAGAVDADKMEEYGFYTPEVVPTEAPEEFAAEATVTNLAQINVEFSRDVDKESAEETDNYEIDDIDIADAALQDDGVTVVLTLDFDDVVKEIEQQYVTDLVIDGVKDLDDEAMDDFTIEDIEFIDTEIPTAIDAAVVGNDTFKVTFSEPMKGELYGENEYRLDKDDFRVNGGKAYVKKVTLQNNNTEVLVEMYSKLKEGEVDLQVRSGSKDFAGFGVIGKSFTLEVVPDEEAPVVIGYEKATQQKVTLIWNEDIEQNCKDGEIEEYFYHTNSKNGATDIEIDGNKLTIDFGEEDDNWLPEGYAYVYVADEAVNDYWDNENDQQMKQIQVEVDETDPEVKKVEVSYDEDLETYKLKITFTEEVTDTAEDEDNYIILDDEGDEIEGIIDDIDWDKDDADVATLIFDDDEDMNGDYAVVIDGVKDRSGNKMEDETVYFTVGDEIAPNHEEFEAVVYNAGQKDQMIKISFKDIMATEGNYAVNDIEKYAIVKKDGDQWEIVERLEDIDDVEIDVVDDDKAVEISIPSDEFDLDDGDYSIQIGRVADAAGNKMKVLSTVVSFDAVELIGVKDESAKATATDTVKVTLEDEIDFEVDDFILSSNETVTSKTYRLEYAEVDYTINKDGNTEIIFTIAEEDELEYDLSKEIWLHIVPTVDTDDDDEDDATESANKYGKTLKIGAYPVLDGIAPEVDDEDKDIKFINAAEDEANSTIEIIFTEALSDANESLYAHDLIVKDDDGDELKAGIDFTTKLKDKDENANVLVVTVMGVTDLDDYSIESVDSLEYIEDLAVDADGDHDGNIAKAFDRVKNK